MNNRSRSGLPRPRRGSTEEGIANIAGAGAGVAADVAAGGNAGPLKTIVSAGVKALTGALLVAAFQNNSIDSDTPNTKKRRSNTYNFVQSRNSLSIGERVPEWFGTMQYAPNFIAQPYRLYVSGRRRGPITTEDGGVASGPTNQTERYLFLLSAGAVNVNRVIYGDRTIRSSASGLIGESLFTGAGNVNQNRAFGAQVIRGGSIVGGQSPSLLYHNFINIQAYPINSRIRTTVTGVPTTVALGVESRETIIRSPSFDRDVVRVSLAIDVTVIGTNFTATGANSIPDPAEGVNRVVSRFKVEYRTSDSGSYTLFRQGTFNNYIRGVSNAVNTHSFDGTSLAQILSININLPAGTNHVDLRVTNVPFMNEDGNAIVENEARVLQTLYYYSLAAVTADQLLEYSNYTFLAVYRNAEAVLEGLDDHTLLKVRGTRMLPRPYNNVNTAAATTSAAAAFNYMINQVDTELTVNDANLRSIDSRPFNAIIESRTSFTDFISSLALSTMTRFVIRGTEVFLEDATRLGDPISYFKANDVVRGSLRLEIGLLNRQTVTALSCTYVDSNNNRYLNEYLTVDSESNDEIPATDNNPAVPANLITEDQRIGTVGNLVVIGSTNRQQVINILKQSLREGIYRNQIVVFRTTYQALQISTGDLIGLQHDGVFTSSVSAYIAEVGVDETQAIFILSENVMPEDNIMYIIGYSCLLYTSPSPRDRTRSRMPSSA